MYDELMKLHPDNISNNDSTEKFSKSNLEEFIKDYSLHALESKIPKNTREFYIWMKATLTAMNALSHFINRNSHKGLSKDIIHTYSIE